MNLCVIIVLKKEASEVKALTGYYYSKMDKEEQAVYFSLEEGIRNVKQKFYVPRLEGNKIFDIHFLMRLDNPDIFYSSGIKYRFFEDSTQVEIAAEFLFDKKKLKAHQQAMNSRIEKIARPAMGLKDDEKLKYVHDFICNSVKYDKLKKQYSHEIIGPLGQGVGVCEGISKTVKVLCDRLGIWCTIAVSEANPDKGIKYRHAWNIVRIDGKYYHMDATFDNSLGKGGDIRYDYFMLSDKQIFRDHEPVIREVPSCEDNDSFFYKKNKMSFTKIEDISKRTLQAVRKGRQLTFHWRNGYLTKDILDQLVKVIEEAALTKDKHAKIYVNIAQAVLSVTFVEGEGQIIKEDADESSI